MNLSWRSCTQMGVVLAILHACTVLAEEEEDFDDPATRNESSTEDSFGISLEEIDLVRKLLLPRGAVTLAEGTYEVEVAMGYQRDSRNILGIIETTQRSFTVPLSLRYGLTDRVELSSTIPFNFTSSEVDDSETVDKIQERGVGDFGFGFKYVMVEESAEWPALIASFDGQAPTGKDAYRTGATGLEPGGGHWALSPGLFFVREDEPVVLFGGIGHTYLFPRFVDGETLRPGASINCSIGMGMAINRKTSISGQVAGAKIFSGDPSGDAPETAGEEPWHLRIGATRRTSKFVYMEPSLTIGLTDDAPDLVFGWGFVYQGRGPCSQVQE